MAITDYKQRYILKIYFSPSDHCLQSEVAVDKSVGVLHFEGMGSCFDADDGSSTTLACLSRAKVLPFQNIPS